MHYYSTNNPAHHVSLRDAVLKGLAGDGGLYMPEKIPELPESFFQSLHQLSQDEIAFQVAEAFFSEDIPNEILYRIVSETVNFPLPVIEVSPHLYSLELYHGPTLAFKDVGARFMARMLAHFNEKTEQAITVLVATSGDTGSAVANGFLNVKGIRVVILYPSGKVSNIQEKQLTTLGNNITALEVEGNFDDCQRLVKQAFSDKALNKQLTLTSANSINIARLIPQSFYYFIAYAQLNLTDKPVVFCVPSGNFGNLTAGLVAKRMGLPIHHFVAATNANDVVPQYLSGGVFSPRPSVSTISNAMDVGNPSNFVRMLELYQQDIDAMRKDITALSFSDAATKETIKTVYAQYHYLLDPHGAVGYAALKQYLEKHDALGIFLETAHPAKFLDVVESVIGEKVELPLRLASCLEKEKSSIKIKNEYYGLKSFLLDV